MMDVNDIIRQDKKEVKLQIVSIGLYCFYWYYVLQEMAPTKPWRRSKSQCDVTILRPYVISKSSRN